MASKSSASFARTPSAGGTGLSSWSGAFALEGTILDYRIQRSRERGTAAIVTERFREQFTGKTMTDPFTVGSSKDINHGAFGFVPDGAESVASAIAYSAKKNLAIMKYLLLEY